jgi:hypothetical protein
VRSPTSLGSSTRSFSRSTSCIHNIGHFHVWSFLRKCYELLKVQNT